MKHLHPIFALVLLAAPSTAWSQATDNVAPQTAASPALPPPPPDDTTPAPPPAPALPPASWLFHVPPIVLPTGAAIVLAMDLLHPELVRAIDVHYRVAVGAWVTRRAQRGTERAYTVTLPAPPPDARSVDYYITVQSVTGTSRAAFASESDPQTIVLRPESDDYREATELAHNHGNRLEFSGGGEYTSLGSVACGMGNTCADNWYDAYGMVRYHFFRTIRSVAVRVDRLVGNAVVDGQPVSVGLVAATTEVEFALSDTISLHTHGIIGANQTTVQVGGGGSLEIGVGTPTRVELAFSGILNYGMVGSAWMRFDLLRGTPFGAGIELTNQPGNSDAAVRLLFELGRRFGRHVTVMARGGYGARLETAGGFSGGGYLMVGF